MLTVGSESAEWLLQALAGFHGCRERHPPSCNGRGGALTVDRLIIEENVGPECRQELGFLNTTEKERLVDHHVPGKQRPDHTFMSRSPAGGNQRGPDGRLPGRRFPLDRRQAFEKSRERPLGKRLPCLLRLVARKRLEAVVLKNLFRLVGKKRRVSVDSNPNLPDLIARLVLTVIKDRGPDPGFQRRSDVVFVLGKKQVNPKRSQVGRQRRAGDPGPE